MHFHYVIADVLLKTTICASIICNKRTFGDAVCIVNEQDSLLFNGRKDQCFKSHEECHYYACNCIISLFTDPTEVYTWGNNTNFSLGHGNQESRHHPELVDVFARTGVYIKQVC